MSSGMVYPQESRVIHIRRTTYVLMASSMMLDTMTWAVPSLGSVKANCALTALSSIAVAAAL